MTLKQIWKKKITLIREHTFNTDVYQAELRNR